MFWLGLLVIAGIFGFALLRLAARVGVTEVVSSVSSPLPFPTSSLDFSKLKLYTFPPAPTLPPDLRP